ncbi:hypothetical protein BC829DRAFT_475769 [Chytridium lagenaria]|nr:hypothetical protein BC829DRAFT_475769 [Chytridium lagenaria]
MDMQHFLFWCMVDQSPAESQEFELNWKLLKEEIGGRAAGSSVGEAQTKSRTQACYKRQALTYDEKGFPHFSPLYLPPSVTHSLTHSLLNLSGVHLILLIRTLQQYLPSYLPTIAMSLSTSNTSSPTLFLNLREPEGCKPAVQWPGNLTAYNCVDNKIGDVKVELSCETAANTTWVNRWRGAAADSSNSTVRADFAADVRQLLPFNAGDKECSSFIVSDDKRNASLTFLMKNSNASRQLKTSPFALVLLAAAIISLFVSPAFA